MKNPFNHEIIQMSFLIVAANVSEAVEYLRGRDERIQRARKTKDR